MLSSIVTQGEISGWYVVGRGRGCFDGCGLHSFEAFADFLFSYFSTGDLLSVTPKNIVFLPTLPFAQKKKNQKTRRRHEVEQ